ncbi:MAG: right-handed parallel beta-helix repeat-containing protein [Gammaproteobacteria bacterium]|nr:right-handed parallel beta-helix repeat-containing protein [Gammaproteobacteria bacterium]
MRRARQVLRALVVLAGGVVFGPGVLGATVNANCASESLQSVINAAGDGDTILLSGTCNENVEVGKTLTLDGQNGATITATSGVVVNLTASGTTLKRLTVTGGDDAISVSPLGSHRIQDSVVEDAGGVGIFVHGGHVVILSSTIRNNGEAGIEVGEHSFASIVGNTIRDNDDGVVVIDSSGADMEGNSIRNNAQNGVYVANVSFASLNQNAIDANGKSGVLVTGNSGVELGHQGDDPNTTTTNNGGYGINCKLNSSVTGTRGTLNGDKGPRYSVSGCIDKTKP